MYFLSFICFFIFISTYALSYISVLYTESFVLFLSFFTIFIYAINNTSYKIAYTKDDFKWNEIILFYISLKNWNRYIIRDRSVKILAFLDLVLQMKKYQINWLKKNIIKLEQRDINALNMLSIRRLEILKKQLSVTKKYSDSINNFTFGE
jgi:hypothetical protein